MPEPSQEPDVPEPDIRIDLAVRPDGQDPEPDAWWSGSISLCAVNLLSQPAFVRIFYLAQEAYTI